MPTIATWNVNSVKARLPNVLDWLKSAAPDVVFLQELKCETHAFPSMEIEDLGYNLAVHGQKSYNGVAILSKRPLDDVVEGLAGDDADDQARYLEATVDDLRLICLYAPNGNPPDTDKYPYKLSWMARLRDRVAGLLETEQPLVIGGDYNVIPEASDCYDAAAWAGDALFLPETRKAYRSLVHLGLTDAFRAIDARPGQYTFWTTSAAPGSTTTASASTTSYCRPRPPTAWKAAPSTVSRAPSPRPATTPRSSSPSPTPERPARGRSRWSPSQDKPINATMHAL